MAWYIAALPTVVPIRVRKSRQPSPSDDFERCMLIPPARAEPALAMSDGTTRVPIKPTTYGRTLPSQVN